MSYGTESLSNNQANALLHFQANIQSQTQGKLETHQLPTPPNDTVKNDYKAPTGSLQPNNTPQARRSRLTSFLKGGAKVLKAPTCVVCYALALPAAAVGAVVIGIPLAIANKLTSKNSKSQDLEGARRYQPNNSFTAQSVRSVNPHGQVQANTASIIASGAKTAAIAVLYPQDALSEYIKSHGK